MRVRTARGEDEGAIRQVVAAAFSRNEEADIVSKARAECTALIELVFEDAGVICGHILFSRMTCDPPRFIAGLGPLAVTPDHQSTGIGSALSRHGIERCRVLGVEAIVVLGHTNYYPRFGFSHGAAQNLISPYAALPAFMAIALRPGALEAAVRIDFPAAFRV